VDDIGIFAVGRRQLADDAAGHHLRKAHDRIERRAELVADGGEEA
jgi:hypothetical protein